MSTRLLSAELRRCTLIFCAVLFAGSFAFAQTPSGTRLLRTPTVSATQIAFAYAQNIWVVPRAGGAARRVTSFQGQTTNPHFSPDGKWMLFLSFAKGVQTHNDKLPGTQLRMMPAPGARPAASPKIQVLTTFFGGQGAVNVNSCSPDSKRFAYVIYEPLPAAAAAR